MTDNTTNEVSKTTVTISSPGRGESDPAIGTPDEREFAARLSASEVACYRWPDNSDMRQAFCDGAAHIVGTPDNAREALRLCHQEIVLAIAFLGRDGGTDRLEGTAKGLIERLVKADAKARAALSPASANEENIK